MKEVKFSTLANAQLEEWETTDMKIYKRIEQLIESIQENPHKGIGKPEPLKYELTGYWSRRYHTPSVAYAGRYDLVGLYADPLRHDRGTVEEFIRRLFAMLPKDALLVDDIAIYYQAQFMQQHYGQRPDVRLLLLQPLGMAGWGTPSDELIATCNAATNRVFITATSGPAAGLVTALKFGGWRAEKFPLGDAFWIYELRR